MAAVKLHSELIWNFSATSHSKRPVDGIGAALKHSATDQEKTRKCIINGAADFYRKQSTVKVTVVSAESATSHITKFGEGI